MSRLFAPFTLRGTTFRNRVWVSPMCQYSASDGRPSDWHLVHYGALARGGAGLVLAEATAVSPEGRITPADLGLWSDEQAADLKRITDFVRSQGAVPGVQLAHAGRKGSTALPWHPEGSVAPSDGGWQTLAPSALAFGGYAQPKELATEELPGIVEQWRTAARRALAAGYEVVEIHAAHGYLLHEFLSPLSNHRADEYGGDLAGRSRLLLEIVDAVRAELPERNPLFVRVSATDWVDGGLTVDEVAEVARTLADHGVDLVDVSSAGNTPDARIAVGPGYQVPLARTVREGAGVPVSAVGLITEPAQAETILAEGSADAVFLGRVLLREPTWPQRAAATLRDPAYWPRQYQRAAPVGA